MRLKPLNDRILVKRVNELEKTAGGIIIPDSAKEKPIEAHVVAVGEGKLLDDGSRAIMDIKEGDKVLFGKYSGTEIKLEGVEHLILNSSDILAIVE